MKYLCVLVLIPILAGAGARAQTTDAAGTASPPKKPGSAVAVYQGYLVDAMCAQSMLKRTNVMERAKKHKRECALDEHCAASGYGILYQNGTWAKFDGNGDRTARAVIEKSAREDNLLVEVGGRLQGETLAVEWIKEVTVAPRGPEGKPAAGTKSESKPTKR